MKGARRKKNCWTRINEIWLQFRLRSFFVQMILFCCLGLRLRINFSLLIVLFFLRLSIQTELGTTKLPRKNGISLPISAFTSIAFKSLFISVFFEMKSFRLVVLPPSLKIMHFIIAISNQVNRKFFSLHKTCNRLNYYFIDSSFFLHICNHMNEFFSVSLSPSFFSFAHSFWSRLFSIQLESSFPSCKLNAHSHAYFEAKKKSDFNSVVLFGKLSIIMCLSTIYFNDIILNG